MVGVGGLKAKNISTRPMLMLQLESHLQAPQRIIMLYIANNDERE
jgi:hypothetical protein